MAGAASKGAETETIYARKLQIAPCRHCDGCQAEGQCVVQDEMQEVYPKLREADCLVLASPIHFMGLAAQVKALVDRCQAFWATKYVLKRPIAPGRKRKGLFVAVGGTRLRDLFEPARASVRALFKTLDMDYAGDLVFSGIDEKGAIKEHPTALADARQAGQRLVEE
jgi:multimeric flavodoxin WrbA